MRGGGGGMGLGEVAELAAEVVDGGRGGGGGGAEAIADVGEGGARGRIGGGQFGWGRWEGRGGGEVAREQGVAADAGAEERHGRGGGGEWPVAGGLGGGFWRSVGRAFGTGARPGEAERTRVWLFMVNCTHRSFFYLFSKFFLSFSDFKKNSRKKF